MEIKHSIFRRGKKGANDAAAYRSPWTLRFTFTDQLGVTRRKTYQFETRNEALDARAKLEAQLNKTQGQSVIGDKMTFLELATYAKTTFYRPAEIAEGRKVAGIKSYKQTYSAMDSLAGYFGKRRLSSLTRNDMNGYKLWRLKQGDRRGRKGKLKLQERNVVKLSTVNRDLATFKHMIKFAYAEGWIVRDITRGSNAIDPDAETARTRTLTDPEEMRLLAACVGARQIEYYRRGKKLAAVINAHNPYLKAIVLLGLDSGLRRGEILKLDWQDVDFATGIIRVLGTHTKTQKARAVPMTRRTQAELTSLPNFGREGKIFPFNDFKRSWATALTIARIKGFTFHDLRRTFVTRLQTGGVSIGIAAELAGHSRLETTQKHYTSADNPAVVQDATRRIDAANDARVILWPDVIQ
jgi:integrase